MCDRLAVSADIVLNCSYINIHTMAMLQEIINFPGAHLLPFLRHIDNQWFYNVGQFSEINEMYVLSVCWYILVL